MTGAIYSITQISTNKIYIGLTSNFIRRKNEHIYELRKNKHYNPHLQRAWNKYGKDDFKFEILTKIQDPDELKQAEIRLIEEHNATDKEVGFNMSLGGDMAKWRAIKQYNKDGTFVKEYDTISLAAAQLGKLSTPIWRALNKRIPTAYGYQWNYSDEEQSVRHSIGDHSHKGIVQQFDLAGNWIADYNSAMDAGKALQPLTRAKSYKSVAINIRKVCCKKMGSYYNFIWKYKN